MIFHGSFINILEKTWLWGRLACLRTNQMHTKHFFWQNASARHSEFVSAKAIKPNGDVCWADDLRQSPCMDVNIRKPSLSGHESEALRATSLFCTNRLHEPMGSEKTAKALSSSIHLTSNSAGTFSQSGCFWHTSFRTDCIDSWRSWTPRPFRPWMCK